jgi:hypothetical protein
MRIDWKEKEKEIKQLMNIMSDEQLAAKYGIKTHRFKDARKRMGFFRPTDTFKNKTYILRPKVIKWSFWGMDVQEQRI